MARRQSSRSICSNRLSRVGAPGSARRLLSDDRICPGEESWSSSPMPSGRRSASSCSQVCVERRFMMASQNFCSNVFSAERMRRSRRSGAGGSMCSARQRLVISAAIWSRCWFWGRICSTSQSPIASASSSVASRKPRNSRICAVVFDSATLPCEIVPDSLRNPGLPCEIFDDGQGHLLALAGKRPSCWKNLRRTAKPRRLGPCLLPSSSFSSGRNDQCSASSSAFHSRFMRWPPKHQY